MSPPGVWSRQVKPPVTEGSYSPHPLVMGREALNVTVCCLARVLGTGQSDVKLYTSSCDVGRETWVIVPELTG